MWKTRRIRVHARSLFVWLAELLADISTTLAQKANWVMDVANRIEPGKQMVRYVSQGTMEFWLDFNTDVAKRLGLEGVPIHEEDE